MSEIDGIRRISQENSVGKDVTEKNSLLSLIGYKVGLSLKGLSRMQLLSYV